MAFAKQGVKTIIAERIKFTELHKSYLFGLITIKTILKQERVGSEMVIDIGDHALEKITVINNANGIKKEIYF